MTHLGIDTYSPAHGSEEHSIEADESALVTFCSLLEESQGLTKLCCGVKFFIEGFAAYISEVDEISKRFNELFVAENNGSSITVSRRGKDAA